MKKNFISAKEGFLKLQQLDIPIVIAEIYHSYLGYLNMMLGDFE